MVAVIVLHGASATALFGRFADVALIANLILIMGVLSDLQATLTLPGIAGIVLTLGMAVDANVLVFERIREEARNFKNADLAVDAGYRRALTTIFDANITTLIAALLLYYFGSGPVRGFAVTLAIGLVTSMFTAIMVTRLMVVDLAAPHPRAVPADLSAHRSERDDGTGQAFPTEPRFDFAGKRRFTLPFSGALDGLSLMAILVMGLNFGVDFRGGILMEIKTKAQTADISADPRRDERPRTWAT